MNSTFRIAGWGSSWPFGVNVARHAIGFQVSAAILGPVSLPAVAGALAETAGIAIILLLLATNTAVLLYAIMLVLLRRVSQSNTAF
jgi:hypothetical protein